MERKVGVDNNVGKENKKQETNVLAERKVLDT